MKRLPKHLDACHLLLEFFMGGAITFASAIFCMWLCQYACGLSLGEIITKSAFFLYMMLYGILFGLGALISGRFWLGNCIAMGFLFAVTVLDAQVYAFRGAEILPGEVAAIRTALSVAGQYRPQITLPLLTAAALLAVYCTVPPMLLKFRKGFYWRGIALAVLVCASVCFAHFIDMIPLIAFEDNGMRQNTFPLNFCRQVYSSSAEKPEGYSPEMIQTLEDTYAVESPPPAEHCPVIIAIMNESFADLSVIGDVPAGEDLLPFFHSMGENAIKGWTQVPVFGAGTANTEWEFLTGHSMHFLPTGATPYSDNALTDSYASIVSNLKRIGYHCIAMHPHLPYSYSCSSVYPSMGFDDILFIDDFPRKNLVRGRVSDQEMYEEVIRQYEAHTDDSPLFLFGVTIQNHGGYEYEGDDYEKTVTLQNMSRDYPKAEQFFSALKVSDDALAYLISYFQAVDEDVVIAFSGDHQPSIEPEFYEEIAGEKTAQQLWLDKHTVPFFVWANYDIEEQTVDTTSVNYLTNYIYDAAGIPKPGYHLFLEQLQAKIPALSTNQAFSQSQNRYVDYADLPADEAEWLRQYHALVYNAVYDAEGRSKMFWGAIK